MSINTISKKIRATMKKVYFSDDITLPSDEISSLTTEIKNIVTDNEFILIMNYKSCRNNIDLIKARQRKNDEKKKRQAIRDAKKQQRIEDDIYFNEVINSIIREDEIIKEQMIKQQSINDLFYENFIKRNELLNEVLSFNV